MYFFMTRAQNILVTAMLALLLSGLSLFAQDEEKKDSLRFTFKPDSINLEVDGTAEIHVQLLNEAGEIHQHPFLLFIGGGQSAKSVRVAPRTTGEPGGEATIKLTALKPGTFKFTAQTVGPRNTRVRGTMPVNVAFPSLEKIKFITAQPKLYAGTTVHYSTAVYDAAGLVREDATAIISSENTDIASTDAYGNVTAHQEGKTNLIARVNDIEAKYAITVVKNPITHIDLSAANTSARTGDVVQMTAVARNALGGEVADAPIYYSVTAKPADPKEPHAVGEVDTDGRFVAENAGDYTVVAYSGNVMNQVTLRIEGRDIQKDVEVVGHGGSLDVYTSDLWVWEGVDGRDYCVTGTWEAKGHALFWDVTDPSDIQLIDTVAVDARTVNDVKVSEDGRIAVISREGASNRKNGIVILDVTNPADVKVLSEYNEKLTGGVHNVFIYQNHVYAVNNGTRYDIINIEDPTKPYRVGLYEVDSPGHSVHDVWIENGIAYSSNWQDGLKLVDIGGVSHGMPFEDFVRKSNPEVTLPPGSPSNPVEFASYEYPSGWNHAAFPFYSKSTGKFYVLAGDEAFPYGIGSLIEHEPEIAAGWIHFIDFTDPANPIEVARYGVPEAGSHNFWVDGDTLYAAFYNGGVRVVDISGDLQGDLYSQGREIAWYLPMEADGVVANAPMVWGPQPYKGNLFFSDMNSGLWAVKLVDKKKK